MNKQSTLIRRVAILAAAVLLVAVAVITAGQCLGARLAARRAAQTRLLEATRYAAEAVGDDAAFAAATGTLRAEYAAQDFDWALLDLTRDLSRLPGAPAVGSSEALTSAAYQGHESSAVMKDGAGRSCAYAAAPVWADGALSGVLVTRALLPRADWLWPLISLAASILLGLIVLSVLLRKWIAPIAAHIRGLRDVAVRVSEADFEAHADEKLPGELGELGTALNNVSNQLSRNMYMLIVERNRLKHMLNGLSEGIVAIDNEGRITHRNPALQRMFSPAPATVGMDTRMRVIPDQTIWDDFDHVIESGTSVTRNIEMRDMVLRLIITPIVDEIGANAGAVGLFSDITQLERLERTRRDYVANVSHEMRTPLTAMRALIEPLKEGMVTSEDDRMRYYDIIMREIMRLSRLINDLMELSRLQSGTLSIQTRPMLLEDLVLDICDRYGAIAEDHDLTFSVDADFSKCPPVVGNADRIEQLLVILLDNAIKYTPEGGRVSLSASWDADRVVLSVSDTGIGIAPEDLPYVFDRFYKVDKAHSGMGSGLGLSIARELLKWMKEDIWVNSEKGKGSTFSFTIRRVSAAKREDRE